MRVGKKLVTPPGVVRGPSTDPAPAAPAAPAPRGPAPKAELSGLAQKGAAGQSPLGVRLFGLNPFVAGLGPLDDELRADITGPGGAHVLLRRLPEVFAARAQDRLAAHIDLDHAVQVQLHGDAHVEQYVQNGARFGLSDLDCTRRGAFAEDLVRLWSSVLLKSKDFGPGTEAQLQAALREGYLAGVAEADARAPAPSPSLFQDPEALSSARSYLDAGSYLARLMRENPLPVDDPRVVDLVAQYAATCEGDLPAAAFRIVEAGATRSTGVASRGSERLMVVLEGASLGRDDDVFVEFKPQDMPGAEAVAANRLFGTPERMMGHATRDGIHYWVHELDAAWQELETLRSPAHAAAAVSAIARQLGRGHARSADDKAALVDQVQSWLDEVCVVGRALTEEIEQARDQLGAA